MARMKGLKPTDQDGDLMGHGDLRIPELKPACAVDSGLAPAPLISV
jgi:hypothetical protein